MSQSQDPEASFQEQMAGLAESVKKIVPMICVPDIDATLDWYVSIGFKELARFGEDGVAEFGMLSFGKAEIMFRLRPQPAQRDANIWLSHDVTLWFYTDKIDELYRLLKSGERAGIEFAEDIYDPFYGGRQFSIRDPNGYILLFLQN